MNLLRTAISTQLSYRQQVSPFSIFAKCASTKDTLNSQPPKKPRKPNSSQSLTCSQTPNKDKQPLTSLPTWPRPAQIPYQPKLPNFVNLVGVVQSPVQFHTAPDGKDMAATFVSQNDGVFVGNSSTSVLVPVVFEGHLASIVANHVKVNDCVYVTGKVSLKPLPFSLSGSRGEFFFIGNEFKFVEGLDMKGWNVENENVVEEYDGDRKYSVDNNSKVIGGWDEFFSNVNQWSVIATDDKGVKGGVEGFERKVDGKRLDLDSSTPVWVYDKLDELNLGNKIEGKKIEPLDIRKKSARNVEGTTKDANSVLNSWRDLVKNPTDWLDYREMKASGSVKAKHPDFKNRTNGTSLWLNTAPNWVLAGLAGLNVSGKGKKGDSLKEESWKDLVENPDKWWDNRLKKNIVKSPDFRHKETSEGLWLSSSPKWVLSQLPCSKT